MRFSPAARRKPETMQSTGIADELGLCRLCHARGSTHKWPAISTSRCGLWPFSSLNFSSSGHDLFSPVGGSRRVPGLLSRWHSALLCSYIRDALLFRSPILLFLPHDTDIWCFRFAHSPDSAFPVVFAKTSFINLFLRYVPCFGCVLGMDRISLCILCSSDRASW